MYKIKDDAMRVSVISVIINIMLSAFKLFAGIFANSGAMISDAVHSVSDVFSTLVVMVGIKLSRKESDTRHQYGHERMECIASQLLAILLFVTGVGIGYSALKKIIGGNYDALVMPGKLALVAAIFSIVVKEIMFRYTKCVAIRINSTALMADAWHHRSDSLSSIGSFIGIFGAMLGFKVLDPIAGFVICLFILKAAVDIFIRSVDRMVDKSCDEETIDKIKNIILNTDGVIKLDMLKTRIFGAKIYVDVEICADGELSLKDAHEIAESVHDNIEENMTDVKHCMVHVNPI